MSIANTLTAIGNKLLLATPQTQPKLVRVYSNPAEAVNMADFPCAILALAPGQQNQWAFETAGGWGRNDYTVAIWLLVGARTTGINELYGRMVDWPKAIADVLAADITLSGQVAFIGDEHNSNQLFQWSPKLIPWADGTYFGLEFLLPVCERFVQTIG
jgi:hypothetical protein